jgi:deoxycytidylate deaminase
MHAQKGCVAHTTIFRQKYVSLTGNYVTRKKHVFYIDTARKHAQRSQVECSKHCAVVVLNSKIVSVGINRYDVSRYQSKDSKMYFRDYKNYISNHHMNPHYHSFTVHAEVDAVVKMLKTWPKELLAKMPLKMYVIRVQNGSLSYSYPCLKCQNFLRQFAQMTIYFST